MPLGCLEELEIILEGTWVRHLKAPSHILEREALFKNNNNNNIFLIRIGIEENKTKQNKTSVWC